MQPVPECNEHQGVGDILSERAATIPSAQSTNHGHLGMVVTQGEYALVSNTPWRDVSDPGPMRGDINGTATATQKRDVEVIYQGAKMMYNSQSNIMRAINDALNAAIPQPFRRSANTIGIRTFCATDDTQAKIAMEKPLQRKGGKRATMEGTVESRGAD